MQNGHLYNDNYSPCKGAVSVLVTNIQRLPLLVQIPSLLVLIETVTCFQFKFPLRLYRGCSKVTSEYRFETLFVKEQLLNIQ